MTFSILCHQSTVFQFHSKTHARNFHINAFAQAKPTSPVKMKTKVHVYKHIIFE